MLNSSFTLLLYFNLFKCKLLHGEMSIIKIQLQPKARWSRWLYLALRLGMRHYAEKAGLGNWNISSWADMWNFKFCVLSALELKGGIRCTLPHARFLYAQSACSQFHVPFNEDKACWRKKPFSRNLRRENWDFSSSPRDSIRPSRLPLWQRCRKHTVPWSANMDKIFRLCTFRVVQRCKREEFQLATSCILSKSPRKQIIFRMYERPSATWCMEINSPFVILFI